MPKKLLIAAALFAVAQPASAQFGLNPKHITSYWSAVTTYTNARMYSTYTGGNSTFYFFLKNLENDGNVVDAAGGHCGVTLGPCTDTSPYRLHTQIEGGAWLFYDFLGAGALTYGNVFAAHSDVLDIDPGISTSLGPVDDAADRALLLFENVNTGYFGCTVPDDADLTFSGVAYWQTCAETGNDGWVGLWFSVKGRRDVTGIYFPTGDNVHVTPEPFTMVLFGTGLVGIGAIRRRRRGANASLE